MNETDMIENIGKKVMDYVTKLVSEEEGINPGNVADVILGVEKNLKRVSDEDATKAVEALDILNTQTDTPSNQAKRDALMVTIERHSDQVTEATLQADKPAVREYSQADYDKLDALAAELDTLPGDDARSAEIQEAMKAYD